MPRPPSTSCRARSPLGLHLSVSQGTHCLSEPLGSQSQTPQVWAAPFKQQDLGCPSAGPELRIHSSFLEEVEWSGLWRKHLSSYLTLRGEAGGNWGTFSSKAEKGILCRPPPLSPSIKEKPCFLFLHLVCYLQGLGKFWKSRKVGDWAVVLEWGDLRVF